MAGSKKRNVLLLSATIKPPEGMPALVRVDPAQRLADYSGALGFYSQLLSHCFDAIVFAENSQWDLSSLRRQMAKDGMEDKVEFISFNGLNYPPSYGRGYGEFLLVDYAVAHSEFLRAFSEASVWKCTGRYIVRNMAEIVRGRPDCDLYCHMRNYRYPLCELFLLSWNLRAYEAVIHNVYHALRNDVIPGVHTIEETLFRKIVDSKIQTISVVPRFKVVPLIEGVRGWNNSRYSDRIWSPKIVIRRLTNLAAPWLWI